MRNTATAAADTAARAASADTAARAASDSSATDGLLAGRMTQSAGRAHGRLAGRILGLFPFAALLVGVLVLSMVVGAGDVSPGQVWNYLLHPAEDEFTSQVVWQSRIPRTVLILVGGVAFGLAGALMQAITRNPLTDPGILGVNNGASLAVVIGLSFFGISGISGYMWWALAGALVTSVAVVIIGNIGAVKGNPIKLTLSGVALGAVLQGITSALLLIDSARFERMRGWSAGSTASQPLDNATSVLPLVIVGVGLAFALTRALDVLMLGDASAIAMGAHPGRIRLGGLVAIALLAGGATAAMGPVGFIGLITPHLCRLVIGPHQGWIMTYSVLVAPIILGVADVIGRVITAGEVPVGVVTPVIGAPLLIYMVRRFRVGEL